MNKLMENCPYGVIILKRNKVKYNSEAHEFVSTYWTNIGFTCEIRDGHVDNWDVRVKTDGRAQYIWVRDMRDDVQRLATVRHTIKNLINPLAIATSDDIDVPRILLELSVAADAVV